MPIFTRKQPTTFFCLSNKEDVQRGFAYILSQVAAQYCYLPYSMTGLFTRVWALVAHIFVQVFMLN